MTLGRWKAVRRLRSVRGRVADLMLHGAQYRDRARVAEVGEKADDVVRKTAVGQMGGEGFQGSPVSHLHQPGECGEVVVVVHVLMRVTQQCVGDARLMESGQCSHWGLPHLLARLTAAVRPPAVQDPEQGFDRIRHMQIGKRRGRAAADLVVLMAECA
jgi:hypothetical protein